MIRSTGDGHSSRFNGMLVLAMAPSGSHQIPVVFLYHPDNIPNLHVSILRGIGLTGLGIPNEAIYDREDVGSVIFG